MRKKTGKVREFCQSGKSGNHDDHQMSLARMWPQVNKFEQFSSDDYQMSPERARIGPRVPCSGGREGPKSNVLFHTMWPIPWCICCYLSPTSPREQTNGWENITLEAWWRRGNMFASHCYGLGSTLIPGPRWDVFHPSQPMPGGFPHRVFFHAQKGSKLFRLEPSHKTRGLGQNLLWVT